MADVFVLNFISPGDISSLRNMGVYNDEEEARGLSDELNQLMGCAYVNATEVSDFIIRWYEQYGHNTPEKATGFEIVVTLMNLKEYQLLKTAWGDLKKLDPDAKCPWIERRIELYVAAEETGRPLYLWKKTPQKGWVRSSG